MELANLSEEELLAMVAMILTRPGYNLAPRDLEEIEIINREFLRRGACE